MADDKNKSGTGDPASKGPDDDRKELKEALEKERQLREKLEKDVAKLTAAATKAEQDKQAAEDAKKDELVKVQEKLAAMEAESKRAAEERLRLDVIMETAPEGLPITKARSLARRLAGATREELLEDAKELIADFVPAKNGKDKDDKAKEIEAGPFGAKTRDMPKEELKSGSVGGAERVEKPDDIAKEILSSGF